MDLDWRAPVTPKRAKMDIGWGKKDLPAEPVHVPSSPALASKVQRERKPKGAGDEVGINLRLTPEAWTALGVLAARQRRAKQDILLEALDLVLVKYGEEPVPRR